MTNPNPRTSYHVPAGVAAPRGTQSIVWTVPSTTHRETGITYEVRANPLDLRLECTCPSRVACWHMKAVASGLAGKPHVRYTPTPRPVHTVASVNADLFGR